MFLSVCVCAYVCVCMCVYMCVYLHIYARGCDMQIKKVKVWWGVHTSVHLCMQSINSN